MKSLLLMAALCCAAPAALAATRAGLPPGARIADARELSTDTAEAGPLAARWRAAVDAGRFAQVLGEVESAAPGGEVELALSALVEHLQGSAAGRTEAGKAFLAQLAERPNLLWQRHEETAGDWFVPVVQPGPEAASALAVIGRERKRDAWLARLRSDPAEALGEIDTPDGLVAARDAVAIAAPADLERLESMHTRASAGLPVEVLAPLAARRGSAELYRDALRKASPQLAVLLVAEIPRSLPAAEAVPLLTAAAGNPAVGSVAVLALSEFAQRSDVHERLLGWLDDAALGASAASALVRAAEAGAIDSATLVRQLGQRAAGAKSGGAAPASSVLALRLLDTPASRAALQRIAADPATPAALRAELQR